ncbi:unnamed protein product [Timema podura]|uniref:ELMO domain-containing protein n=1 Tax=Timema podura TaxID=61482 RepID=A0ABN7NK72_TIMPD|nr:unnamed protein product [Timema podura]
MFRSLWSLVYWYLRPLIKWFLRKTTKLCELQRICYGERFGAPRSSKIEYSLEHSRASEINKLIRELNELCSCRRLRGEDRYHVVIYAVNTVLRVKKINPRIHPQFVQSFGKCVEHIWGYRQLVHEVERLRTIQYDADDSSHEDKLLKLWGLLMPDVHLKSRVTKQWQEIGFQGDDPKTDFRGMGILGLENLIYFAEEYPGPASHVLSHSHHPQYGYAFAIVGINLTFMAYHLLKDGLAKTHVYNVSKIFPAIKVFHQLYCYLFYEFDRFWIESKPRNVMDFSFIKDRFENSIRTKLANPLSAFRINISIDNICKELDCSITSYYLFGLYADLSFLSFEMSTTNLEVDVDTNSSDKFPLVGYKRASTIPNIKVLFQLILYEIVQPQMCCCSDIGVSQVHEETINEGPDDNDESPARVSHMQAKKAFDVALQYIKQNESSTSMDILWIKEWRNIAAKSRLSDWLSTSILVPISGKCGKRPNVIFGNVVTIEFSLSQSVTIPRFKTFEARQPERLPPPRRHFSSAHTPERLKQQTSRFSDALFKY